MTASDDTIDRAQGRLTLGYVMSLFLTLLIAGFSPRSLQLVAFIIASMITLVAMIQRTSRRWLIAAFVALGLPIAAAFSPVDVTVASGDTVAVKLVPVVYGPSAAVRDMEAQGMQRDRDFVVCRHYPFQARQAILVLLP